MKQANCKPPIGAIGATHFNPTAVYALWYKRVNGVWHYWAGSGWWKKSRNKPEYLKEQLEERTS